MPLILPPTTVFKPQPPPLWFVTDGELTVGPVRTDLLVRGVEYGRVPDDCYVRAFRGNWRGLYAVREIAALTSKVGPNPLGDQGAEWSRPLERINDEDELFHTVTLLSLAAAGAESAMLHCRDRYSQSLFTRSVIGPLPKDRLGFALAPHDLLLAAARRGRPVVGPPYGPTEDALAMRFAHSAGGVGAAAMIPIFVGGTLTAMLELSRPGHAFRLSDLKRAERLVQQAFNRRAN